jgi:hypothetical protein
LASFHHHHPLLVLVKEMLKALLLQEVVGCSKTPVTKYSLYNYLFIYFYLILFYFIVKNEAFS